MSERELNSKKEQISETIKQVLYLIEAVKSNKKIAFCCITFEKETVERMYFLSDDMSASYILGEIELWREDILDNLYYDTHCIKSYKRIVSEGIGLERK